MVVVHHFLAAHGFFLEFAAPAPPLVDLPGLGLQQPSERKVIGVQIRLLLELEGKVVLALLVVLDIVIAVPEQVGEADELVRQHCQLVLVLVYDIFVVPELHYADLVLLAFLLVVVDLAVPVAQDLAAFADFVLEGAALVLEADRGLADFAVDHGFALAVHEVAQFLELLGLALL